MPPADLSFALAHCLPSAARNRGRILQYLIPVKLLLGQLPSAALLQRHALGHYGPVAAAVRSGDVRSLNEALEAHCELFIRAGTYLLLEKLKAGVYRTLFKRIHNLQKQRDPAKAFQVPVPLFQARRTPARRPQCLTHWSRADGARVAGRGDGPGRVRGAMPAELALPRADSGLGQCVLANLIYRKYIKARQRWRADLMGRAHTALQGYISHKSRVLVLSKVTPFPPLSSVAAAGEAGQQG